MPATASKAAVAAVALMAKGVVAPLEFPATPRSAPVCGAVGATGVTKFCAARKAAAAAPLIAMADLDDMAWPAVLLAWKQGK